MERYIKDIQNCQQKNACLSGTPASSTNKNEHQLMPMRCNYPLFSLFSTEYEHMQA